MRRGEAVNQGRADVHEQNREGAAFGVVRVGTDDEQQQTAANAHDHAAGHRHRAGRIVSRHEERAEHQAARKYLINRHFSAILNQVADEHGRDEGHRDAPVSNLADAQVNAADENRQLAGFAQHTAAVAQKQIHKVHAGNALAQQAEGGSGGRRIHDEVGLRIAAHQRRPADEQNRTRGQRRVHEVAADAAEHLLDEDDGNHAADHRQPPRRVRREVVRQQQTRHDGAPVANRHCPLRQLFPHKFR